MRKSPWSLIVAGGALVAALVGYSIYQNDLKDPQRIHTAEQPALYDDKADGVGLMYFRDGSRHSGGERDGLKSGAGVLILDRGFRYEGEFARDKYNGYGVMWSPQGRAYEAGTWSDNKLTTQLGRQAANGASSNSSFGVAESA